MAKYQLLLPKMGESVAEATIIKWLKNPGDRIEADDAVVEIATDKVDSEVPSPVSGTLVEQLTGENDVVEIGKVIAVIETDEPDGSLSGTITADVVQSQEEPAKVTEVPPATQEIPVETPEPAALAPEPTTASIPGVNQLEQKPQTVAEPFKAAASSRFYSPLVRSIAATEGVSSDELDRIPGTGAEGRLTKDDLIGYLRSVRSGESSPFTATQPVAERPAQFASPEPKSEAPAAKTVEVNAPVTGQAAPQPAFEPSVAAKPASVSGGDEIIEMDRMRRLIADHMVSSVQTSPHVTSFVEADVTNLVLWREKVKNTFEKREGEKITFTPIFIEAVVKAIKDYPMINVSVNGTQIIKKKAINISMATALPSGNLIVPVIKQADNLSLLGITKAVNDLANRARTNKLNPDDVQDGTFTITNVGSFGNIMGTPIINQPQVAILAVGAIKKKPAVIETPEGDAIGIRHMMFLSLSYDHRVVDGALGGSFVRRVADYLEKWDVNRAV
ncbi:2-oxo acid dehydrogenase subunit E2 [Mucilaginibacter hurinus]|uniref:Dihydrolipoamide acetyltransferase component of pyruvate dehydrogenase complex n=1 Tax=Mucilaginibacter hurinus TaxID=2201324 RepID=A0A367GJT8_9SPHI|nr:dihydrolipoamide acetyltransferase family protein [Mucilaginibacter hurinus]RCH53590.1 2-oxo acid dehydrogenase subunit E2 [Mucilaginibacter hurinus]